MTLLGSGSALRTLACTVGAHVVCRRLHHRELLIVMYHGVTADRAVSRRWWHHVHTSDFERQLRYLKAHYALVPLDTALDRLWQQGLDRPTACVTFDDGYRNNRTMALPILQRVGAPATVYVATGMIGTDRRLWTVQLDHAFTSAATDTVDLSHIGLGRAELPDNGGRKVLFRRVLNRVKAFSPSERQSVLETLYEQLAPRQDPAVHEPFAMMDWDDVRAMGSSGMVTFGGHTINHEIVSPLEDAAVRHEIVESIRRVEAEVPEVSRTFAYPNGGAADFDERAVVAVKAGGGIGAVTTIEGLCRAETEHYALKRVAVGSDTTFDQFRLLTSGFVSDVKRLRSR